MVYLDHHATTPVDPRVLEAMLPFFSQRFGNAGSINHAFGWDAQAAVDAARESIAAGIGAEPKEIVFTSGATESNNLAIRGVCEREPLRGRHIVSIVTEHRAVLDPLSRLARRGFEVTLLDVAPHGREDAGLITAEQVAEALRGDTILVSVMLANNEIGAIQPLPEIGAICQEHGVPLHCDATQAVGKIPVDVTELHVDLMSFTAHKIYGPKGVGALYVRRPRRRVRLVPQIEGGGQEGGLRSGTLNVPGIVGFAKALEICLAEMPEESCRLAGLRRRLSDGICQSLEGAELNGPAFDPPIPPLARGGETAFPPLARGGEGRWRLPGNLNLSFAGVDGEALMTNMKDIAVSSGAACTSANPEPSHVLRALGRSEELARASLRFGLGRFNTPTDVDLAIASVTTAVRRLREQKGSGFRVQNSSATLTPDV